MQKISIADIKIHKRAREEVLEIEELAESIKRFGLLNPTIVYTNDFLVAVYRGLEAAKRLGWSIIDANIIVIKVGISSLELEIEENIQRVQFSDEELLNAFKKLNRIKNPGLFKRILQAIIHFFKRLFISEK